MDQFQIQQQFSQAIQVYESGQTEMAEHLLRPLYLQLPDHSLIGNALATVLIGNNKVDEAIKIVSKLMKKAPQQADLNATLGSAYGVKKSWQEANKHLTIAIKNDPQQPNHYFQRGNIFLQSKQPQLALKDFEHCLSLQENFLPALINIGLIHHQAGNLKQAENFYQKVLSIDSKNAVAFVNMGHFKMDSGEVEGAVELYQKAVDVDETNQAAWLSLGNGLLDLNRLGEANQVVKLALKKLNDSAELHFLAGNVFKSSGETNLAEQHFEKSLAINPNLEGVEQSLRRILSKKIPGWHFTMLADEKRNQAYQEALEKAVNSDAVVLDIGTGSGILSMMAARAGASKTYACEFHTELAKAAEKIIAQNGYAEQIQVFNKKSNDLDSENLQKATILVSEILDAGVVGEGVLPSIRHAVANLCAEGVQIIPAKAKVYAQLIEIPSRSKLAPIREISGFDLSYFDRFRVPEEYTTIQLKQEAHRALSEEFFLHEYDFYNIPPAIPDNSPHRKEVAVQMNKSGALQAVVFWFDLYLDDEIMVSSRPGGELLHWGQALYCFPNPVEVEEGDQVNLEMIHSDQQIRFDVKV